MIKRSVSFYSYQESYYTGRKSLEELMEYTGKTLGADGIEILAEQTPVGSFPNPSDADVDMWKGWLDKYGVTPACMDSFIDWMLYKNRILTLKEQVMQMERDLKLASRLGFPVIRVLCPVRKEVMEASIPIAEHYGVKMGIEVHSPMTFTARWITEYLEMMDRSGSKYVGIVPDFGIFQVRPAKKRIENALRSGARQEMVDLLCELTEAHTPFAELTSRMTAAGANAAEIDLANSFARTVYSEPKVLRDIAKYIVHCHGKFYDMDENCCESCIEYEEPLRVLHEIGYDGFISSEYEGQSLFGVDEFCDELEQVRRHQEMLKHLIGR